jgi:hypothetical protein
MTVPYKAEVGMTVLNNNTAVTTIIITGDFKTLP